MSVHIALIHIPVGQESPVVSREIYVDVDIYSRSHRCPAVITTPASPSNPSRRPLVTRDPRPAVVIVPVPPPVMERSPSPRVVRHPHVAMVGHHPVTVGGIRMKISSHARNPYAAIRAVIDPPAMRTQLVVKHVEANASALIVIRVFVIAVTIVSLGVHLVLGRAT